MSEPMMNPTRNQEFLIYTRKFLLSLSDIDVCKKLPNLPSEFNDLLLRDSQDPSPELHRINGDFVSHGLRRNDYSSSPPTRGEFGRLVEETRSPQTVKSSKLAHLFLEEDNKPDVDLPSSRPPGGLLSLYFKVQTFDTKAKGELSMDFPYEGHPTTNVDKLSANPKSQDTLLLSVTAGEANPGKSLTLENLFGSAFMNELQSIGGPVSVGSRFD
ncbi:hypothetical protein Bca52824_053523 [Brassica carinata]|uniref:Uncharacterized protein n=1 Tax=Brassica carinata TaxID=52824 RepID=A0A8X7R937_BRACI|nr:hypothetical protein Bca52824_053523 [Brassica carinata]